MSGTCSSRDPPLDPATRLFSSSTPRRSSPRRRYATAAVNANKVEKRDPPNFIPIKEARTALKDPPAGNEEPEQTATLENDATQVDEMTGGTFSEALNWQWNILRRGLQALGLVSQTEAVDETAGDEEDDEKFFDAVDYAPTQRKYLVEDVSDEDEDILNIRRASLQNTPSRGQSWMHPVNSPLQEKRFAKPDP